MGEFGGGGRYLLFAPVRPCICCCTRVLFGIRRGVVMFAGGSCGGGGWVVFRICNINMYHRN